MRHAHGWMTRRAERLDTYGALFEHALLRRERRPGTVVFAFRAAAGIRDTVDDLARREARVLPVPRPAGRDRRRRGGVDDRRRRTLRRGRTPRRVPRAARRPHTPVIPAVSPCMTTATATSIRERVDALDWDALREQLDEPWATRSPSRCWTAARRDELADLFDGGRFRSTIDMARHRFGDGRYRYFDHPLPEAIAELRGVLLPPPGADRQRLVAAAARRQPDVPARARRAARALPRPPARSGPRR